MRRMLRRIHLGEHADAEFVLAHAGFDARVVAQALEEAEGAVGGGEGGEGEEGVEGVGCFVLLLSPVANAGRSSGFD